MIMDIFGFDEKWIGWIMECITLAHASVMINGSLTDEFHLERGLRQGYSLSPFLFLLAAEGLSIMLKKAINRGLELRDLECFNMALLGKVGWRLYLDYGNLWAMVIRSRWGGVSLRE